MIAASQSYEASIFRPYVPWVAIAGLAAIDQSMLLSTSMSVKIFHDQRPALEACSGLNRIC